jgi:hypothetical protein
MAMTKRERDLLALRYVEIEMELAHIAEGGVVDGDPSDREWELLGELEEIEYRLGVGYFEERDVSG